MTLLVTAPFASVGGCWYVVMAPSVAAERLTRRHETLEFVVLDGDTSTPVRGARVWVERHNMLNPGGVAGASDANGRLRLRVTRDNSHARADAEGYLPGPGVPVDLDSPTPQPLYVFRPPKPFYVLEVPAGFRGNVAVRTGRSVTADERAWPFDDPAWVPGQRATVARLEVADDGIVLPHLPRMTDEFPESHAIRGARFADGTPLPLWYVMADPRDARTAGDGETLLRSVDALPADTLAMWHVASENGLVLTFHVGTLRDAAAAQARRPVPPGTGRHPPLPTAPP